MWIPQDMSGVVVAWSFNPRNCVMSIGGVLLIRKKNGKIPS